MKYEKSQTSTENTRDLIVWKSALKTATTSLRDYFEENQPYLQNDHFASHAKNLLRGAGSVVDNSDSSLIVLQEYTFSLQSIHEKIKYRVEKRKKGIDPDKTMLTSIKEALTKPFTRNATARALFDQFLQIHNTETRK